MSTTKRADMIHIMNHIGSFRELSGREITHASLCALELLCVILGEKFEHVTAAICTGAFRGEPVILLFHLNVGHSLHCGLVVRIPTLHAERL